MKQLVLVSGKSGSGKSTFARMLAENLGYLYVDVDLYAHKIYEDVQFLKKIENTFTKDIYDDQGNFDRKKLGKYIFSQSNKELVSKFNNLTWQKMKKQIDKDIQGKNVVMDYAFLTKTEYFLTECVKILVKSKSDSLRFKKISSRDKIDKSYLQKREKGQLEFDEKQFDFVIENDYNLQNLEKKVQNLTKILKNNQKIQ